MEVNLNTGYNLKETLDLICNNLVEIALRKEKAIANLDKFSCSEWMAEACNPIRLCKFFGKLLIFHIMVFILSQPLTLLFMITSTYILRDSKPDLYLIFGICCIVYLLLYCISIRRLTTFVCYSLLCFILNMSLMFLQTNENYLAANLVVLGASNIPPWIFYGIYTLKRSCNNDNVEIRYHYFRKWI